MLGLLWLRAGRESRASSPAHRFCIAATASQWKRSALRHAPQHNSCTKSLAGARARKDSRARARTAPAKDRARMAAARLDAALWELHRPLQEAPDGAEPAFAVAPAA